MKNSIKRELMNETLTGLLVAATLAAIAPANAWADLSTAAQQSQSSVFLPALQVTTYISYVLGAVMTVAGISNAKKHADNPSSNPLGPAIGKLGAGAAFLAAPTVVGMLQQTAGTTVGGNTATVQTIGF